MAEPVIIVVAPRAAALLPYRPSDAVDGVDLTLVQQGARDMVLGDVGPPVVRLVGPPGTGKTTAVAHVPGYRYELRTVASLVGSRMDTFRVGVTPAYIKLIVFEEGVPPELFDFLDGQLQTIRGVVGVPFGGIRLAIIEREGLWTPSPARSQSPALQRVEMVTVDEFSDDLRMRIPDDHEFNALKRDVLCKPALTAVGEGALDYLVSEDGYQRAALPVDDPDVRGATCTWFQAMKCGFDLVVDTILPGLEVADTSDVTASPNLIVPSGWSESMATPAVDDPAAPCAETSSSGGCPEHVPLCDPVGVDADDDASSPDLDGKVVDDDDDDDCTPDDDASSPGLGGKVVDDDDDDDDDEILADPDRCSNDGVDDTEPLAFVLASTHFEPGDPDDPEDPGPLVKGNCAATAGAPIRLKSLWPDCDPRLYPGIDGKIASITLEERKKPWDVLRYKGKAFGICAPRAGVEIKAWFKGLDEPVVVKGVRPKDGMGGKEWPIVTSWYLPISEYTNQTVPRLRFVATGITKKDDGLLMLIEALHRVCSHRGISIRGVNASTLPQLYVQVSLLASGGIET